MAESTPLTADEQRARFVEAVELLGGQRATATALQVNERTVRMLCKGDRPLHTGWLRDVAELLIRRATDCRQLERQLNPFFAANRLPEQGEERPDARRYDADKLDAAHG